VCFSLRWYKEFDSSDSDSVTAIWGLLLPLVEFPNWNAGVSAFNAMDVLLVKSLVHSDSERR
jgi:hypothetical protein